MPALERELSRARASGVARDNEELELGVRCMAAGIYDDQGRLVARPVDFSPADRLDESWLPSCNSLPTKSLWHWATNQERKTPRGSGALSLPTR